MRESSAFEGQREGEEVVLVFRRHFLTAIRGTVFLLIFVVMGGLISLAWPVADYRFLPLAVGAGIGFLAWLYSFILWHFSFYLLTTERLRQVRQKGLFSRSVVDLELNNIVSASYGVSGLLASLFGYGTILVQTGAGDLVLSKVRRPEKVHAELQNAVHAARGGSADEVVEDEEELSGDAEMEGEIEELE